MKVRHEVTAIHPEKKEVTVKNLETGEEFEEMCIRDSSCLGGAAPYIHHGTKPAVYIGRPLLRVGGTEAIHPLKEEFH